MTSKAQYILALCEAAQQSGAFGLATRLGTQSSKFDVDAAKVIQSIVSFSPATESVAIEFLNEFKKVPFLRPLGSVPLLSEHSPLLMKPQLRQCYLVGLPPLTNGHKPC
jgi:hypothetical protein